MVLLRLLSIATLALLLHSTITGATEVDLLVVARSQQDAVSSASSAATADDPLSTLQIKRYLNVDPIQYFAISVSFSTPEGGALDTCNEEEQMLMGRDINLLLLDYGIGDLGDDADPSYMAGICPMPQSIRGSSRALAGWGYVWKGGGACRLCSRDNRDREDYVQTLASELEIALKNVVLPNHRSCLSKTTTVEVSFKKVAYSEIDVYCGKNQLPILDTIGHMAWEEMPTSLEPERGSNNTCGLCHKLDFSTKGDGETKFKEQGAFLKKNEYQQKSPYGVRIWTFKKDSKTSEGTREDARIFDTAGPGVASYPRLGSPNVLCGGDGIGPGGEPRKPGQNCQAMGNVLIIQEPTMSDPHPSEDGGTFVFTFKDPVFISDIGVMDIASTGQKLKFVVEGTGNNRNYGFEGMGENSAQRILVNQHNVKRVLVKLTGPGAITELNFCPIC